MIFTNPEPAKLYWFHNLHNTDRFVILLIDGLTIFRFGTRESGGRGGNLHPDRARHQRLCTLCHQYTVAGNRITELGTFTFPGTLVKCTFSRYLYTGKQHKL